MAMCFEQQPKHVNKYIPQDTYLKTIQNYMYLYNKT